MNRHDWESVIGRHLDGIASAEEMAALSEKLESDADTRLLYLRLAGIHATLATRELDEPASGEAEDQLLDLVEQLESFTKHPRSRQTVVDGQRWSKPTFLWLLAASAVVFVAFSAGLIYQLASPDSGIAESNKIATQPRVSDASIARITGLSGSLIWNGDRGQIDRDVKVGKELAGGTIEGMAPDSWFELQFNDGSTVMISGTSMLTFADLGQKTLRLREGVFSANVVPQPEGKPMLIRTPSALLEVMGTRFDVEARLASTMLNVTEGTVRMRRLSDGREVDVTAKHRVIADGDGDLAPQRLPEAVNHWKSQLHLRPGGYGKWLPASERRAAAQKAIPLIPPDNPNVTLYLLGIPVSRSDGPPVVVRSDSRFVVRGRLDKPAKVYFGIAVSGVNGEFAGKFRLDLESEQPISKPDTDGNFEVAYRLSNFTLDPCVRDREQELAVRPDDLVLTCVWAFTHTHSPSGLEISGVELIPPNKVER
jgi:hypothetical protein